MYIVLSTITTTTTTITVMTKTTTMMMIKLNSQRWRVSRTQLALPRCMATDSRWRRNMVERDAMTAAMRRPRYCVNLYQCLTVVIGWTRLVVTGWTGRRYLDRESQLRAWWQQDSDTGQWWSYSDGTELQDHFWSAQHWQRVAGDCVQKWNGLHE